MHTLHALLNSENWIVPVTKIHQNCSKPNSYLSYWWQCQIFCPNFFRRPWVRLDQNVPVTVVTHLRLTLLINLFSQKKTWIQYWSLKLFRPRRAVPRTSIEPSLDYDGRRITLATERVGRYGRCMPRTTPQSSCPQLVFYTSTLCMESRRHEMGCRKNAQSKSSVCPLPSYFYF